MEQAAESAARERERYNTNNFPTAAQMKKSCFDLDDWLRKNGAKIVAEIKESRSYTTAALPIEDDRAQIKKFFTGRGYMVREERDCLVISI